MTEIAVIPGAEPFYAENGNVGVLVSHGYTGNPYSMRYLAEAFAKAGFTVALPRLRGHGTTPADMATSTASPIWPHLPTDRMLLLNCLASAAISRQAV